MEITFLTFLIPLGVILFLFKPSWLFYSFIFFIPFSPTAVLNVQNITFGVTPAHFLPCSGLQKRLQII